MQLHLHVKPNSKTDSLFIDENNVLHARIHAQPTEGKANKYLIEYLSEVFNVSKSKIEIIKGHKTSNKTISIDANEEYINNILSRLKNSSSK